MASSLADQLIADVPVERGGSIAANRLDYQCHWTLCEILRRHDLSDDYLIVTEFHDDVLILNASINPTSVSFVQVKTTSTKHWTRSSLLRCNKKNASSRSILGKLCSNYLRFSTNTSSLVLVSNAKYKLTHQSGKCCTSYDIVKFSDCSKADQGAIQESIAEELRTNKELLGSELLELRTDELSLNGYESHSLGQLTQFLHRREQDTANVYALFVSVRDEIRRGQTRESIPGSFEELARRKGISRVRFDNMLAARRDRKAAIDYAQLIRERLNSEHVPVVQTNRISQAAARYCAARLDQSNKTLADASMVAARSLAAIDPQSSLWDAMQMVVRAQADALRPVITAYSTDFAYAIVGVASFEAPTVSDACESAEDETA